MTADRNFDALAERFHRQIYGTDKGRIRTALIREDLETHIPWIADSENSGKYIIDAGGGTGLFSAELTRNTRHEVALCDLSGEMLNRARENYNDITPGTSVEFIHTPIQNLPTYVNRQADLILFHAVIEWLENPRQVLKELGKLVKPGGWFSVLFYNRQSLIWRHLMMGNFVYTNNQGAHLKGNGKTLTPDNPQNPEDVQDWLLNNDFEIKASTGIRAIYDNMRSHDRERSSFDDILKAEKIYGRQEPYLNIARYIHLLCQNK
ncbi:methyltransferase domain-containing protein [Sansalvadorimonas sp. 2012CJ34-2]|uniref:tRNA 5-carboxymethoxyuridine methyltransferase n=1 Tax=Parendozoicomonas callyspongiae TaxID=2942213 RepID=A0ABT0PKV5_9GAMM|nr:methyltransferase domain-containing protein [Sansalvadorimonas sp. 2012CJ34-2]MCL6271994.1 methyltransferase domain-containing protein [Sansalvadorimonas sp. 2012CJ34-2]